MNSNPFETLLFVFAVVVAMGARIIPLPAALQIWNPDWILIVIIYWSLVLPYRCGIFSAWVVGIFTDVLVGGMLGRYALVYSLISYICIRLYQRVRRFPLIQQGVFVFGCLLVAQLLSMGIESLHNPDRLQWFFLLPAISGTLVWPFVGVFLRVVRGN